MALGRRDRAPVDDLRRCDLPYEIEDFAAIGEVDRPEIDVRGWIDLEARLLEIDTDHLVLACESIDDPPPGAPQPAGHDHRISHGSGTFLVAKSPGSAAAGPGAKHEPQ